RTHTFREKTKHAHLAPDSSPKYRRSSEAILPTILRQISRRSPRIFRKSPHDRTPETETMILANPLVYCPPQEAEEEGEHVTPFNTDRPPCSRSTTVNSKSSSQFSSLESNCNTVQQKVKFHMMVREMSETAVADAQLKGEEDEPAVSEEESKPLSVCIMTKSQLPETQEKESDEKRRACSVKSVDSQAPSLKSVRNGIASKIAKRTQIKHEQSLKRKAEWEEG
ncbi:hypothetical protein COOONC_21861, partial [Cooperia oncophora]